MRATLGPRRLGTTHCPSGDFMQRQSALRRIAYEVLDIPGIPPGTELAARTLLEAVQAERPDETRVAQYALDLQLCLSRREHYRAHHARLQNLVNQANQRTAYQGLGSRLVVRIRGLPIKSLSMVVWMLIVWICGSAIAFIMASVTAATFTEGGDHWKQYSGFSAPMVALCAAILVGTSTLPKVLRLEKALTSIAGTLGLIVSAFLWLINVMAGGKYPHDPNLLLEDIFKGLGLIGFVAVAIIFIFVLFIFMAVRFSQIMKKI